MRGVDTLCPNFFRTTISGPARISFYYAGEKESVSLWLSDATITIGTNDVPMARPLDGDWKTAKHWEIFLPPSDTRNHECLQ
jgi:hypothetical protein